MITKVLCPVCGEGYLTAHSTDREVKYGGTAGRIPFSYSACDSCGSEVATGEQARSNKRAMIAFRKKVDGLLSGAEVKALREKFGLTQDSAQRIFGGGPVAFSKYEHDDVAQSEQMDSLLRLVLEDPQNLIRLAQRKGMMEVTLPPPQHLVAVVPVSAVETAGHVVASTLAMAPAGALIVSMGRFKVQTVATMREDVSFFPSEDEKISTRAHVLN